MGRPKKLSATQRTTIVDGYRQGYSIRHLARNYGVSYGCIHNLLLEQGVTMRPRGGYHR